MARVTDPVCGMTIESETAADQSELDGRTYYFCTTQCKRQFDADPRRYTRAASSGPADRTKSPERPAP